MFSPTCLKIKHFKNKNVTAFQACITCCTTGYFLRPSERLKRLKHPQTLNWIGKCYVYTFAHCFSLKNVQHPSTYYFNHCLLKNMSALFLSVSSVSSVYVFKLIWKSFRENSHKSKRIIYFYVTETQVPIHTRPKPKLCSNKFYRSPRHKWLKGKTCILNAYIIEITIVFYVTICIIQNYIIY